MVAVERRRDCKKRARRKREGEKEKKSRGGIRGWKEREKEMNEVRGEREKGRHFVQDRRGHGRFN